MYEALNQYIYLIEFRKKLVAEIKTYFQILLEKNLKRRIFVKYFYISFFKTPVRYEPKPEWVYYGSSVLYHECMCHPILVTFFFS